MYVTERHTENIRLRAEGLKRAFLRGFFWIKGRICAIYPPYEKSVTNGKSKAFLDLLSERLLLIY